VRFRIRINLELLRENVSKAEGRVWSNAEVLQWLHDAGFTRAGEWWITEEANLGQLEPEEVIAVEDADSSWRANGD
jgi:hypothetical protein